MGFNLPWRKIRPDETLAQKRGPQQSKASAAARVIAWQGGGVPAGLRGMQRP